MLGRTAMNEAIERVVIVGGGTAGWLAAARLASSPRAVAGRLSITLIEAPDIPTIGVGEGTWPTMRATLAAIGIGEGEFLAACDASFKQGSRFDGWVTGAADDRYLHPFTAPPAAPTTELLAAWRSGAPDLRSEEHTSELQSLMRISYAVFCLKKKNTQQTKITND